MKKCIGNYQNRCTKFFLGMFLLIFLVTTLYSSNFPFIHLYKSNNFPIEDKNIKNSAPLWGWINFTNTQSHINLTYLHGESAIIEGRLFHFYTNLSYQGYRVSLVDDGILQSSYFDFTNQYGRFQINYTIPFYR